ncbi:MAG TPA: hypothetical protein VMQ52_00665 [Candidatus Saccharimonadales bacterium]|nr:hypothetical protein [Candidatus Saccharimonadales bacterium]
MSYYIPESLWDKAREGHSVREPEVWSRLLDKAIRSSVSKATSEQLLDDVSFYSTYWLGWAAIQDLAKSHWHVNPELAVWAIPASLAMQGLSAMFGMLQDDCPVNERRLSLIPAYQIDRLAAVKGLTKTLKLVKSLK